MRLHSRIAASIALITVLDLQIHAQQVTDLPTETIWFYRPISSIGGDLVVYAINSDGAGKLAILGSGQFFEFRAKPGPIYRFALTASPAGQEMLQVSVEPRGQSFVAVDFQRLTLTTPTQGVSDMRGLKPIGPDRVLQNTVGVVVPSQDVARTQPESAQPSPARVGTLNEPSYRAPVNSPPATTSAPQPGPEGQSEDFRRFAITWMVLSYSRQSGINLYGGDLAFEVNPSEHIGIVADLAVHQTIDFVSTLETVTYRFGPRFYANRTGRVTPFAHVLAGGSRLTSIDSSTAFFGRTRITSSTGFNGFALAAGGGMDLKIKPWFAWRAIQAEYSLLRFGELDLTSNGVRIGSGIVFRFGH